MPIAGTHKDLLYKVAYDEAVRALAEQQGVIESFRARAGLLLSTAAITTSFLGAQALQGSNSSPFSWLALAGFVGTAAASVAILWPRPWELTAAPREVIETYIEPAEQSLAEDLHRELSLHMHCSYSKNRAGLKQLVALFQVASSLLAAEVILWIVAIALTP